MTSRQFGQVLIVTGLGTALVAGCGVKQAAPVQSTVPKDGTIASMTFRNVPNQNPDIKIYDMFYWSHGTKVEAYVTVPKNPGNKKYPLLVDCHGGSAVPEPKVSHTDSPYNLESVMDTPTGFIHLVPQYRGYAQSDGTVQGILGDTLDTENAIKAVTTLSIVNPQQLYVMGYSMGGGVALMLASERQNIRAVVAISPFVGWSVEGSWIQQHPGAGYDHYLWAAELAYGDGNGKPFDPNAPAYLQRSPQISKIQAPVLLLQGTNDSEVPWQSVQLFYRDMMKQNKTAKLELYPRGIHGLGDQYRDKRDAALASWFKQYGF